jgi:hypothetical protein
MDWARILAFVTGMVDQELLARIEYLAAENRILKAQFKGRLKLSDAERATLGEITARFSPRCTVSPGRLPQAGGAQIRRLEGASKPGPASDQARGRAADRSHGEGEP